LGVPGGKCGLQPDRHLVFGSIFWKSFSTFAGNLFASFIGQQDGALLPPHRCIAGQDVVLLLVSRLVANHPVGDRDVGKRIARTPRVVT